MTISRYLPGLLNLYTIHLKQEMKSWYNYVRGCKSPVQCRQIFITYQYICMDVRMYVDTCVTICIYACVYLYVHIYMCSIYMFMRRVCIYARIPYCSELRFYVVYNIENRPFLGRGFNHAYIWMFYCVLHVIWNTYCFNVFYWICGKRIVLLVFTWYMLNMYCLHAYFCRVLPTCAWSEMI